MDRLTARQALIDRMGVPIKQGIVRAGTIQTSYLEAGAGPDLLLIHGAGGGAVNWYEVIGPLSARFRIIAPDVVGFGESDKPSAPYDRPFFAAWLRDFVDAIGVQDVCLVGSSQGGAISLQFAHDYPDRVKRLVLLNAGATGNWDAKSGVSEFLILMLQHTLPTKAMTRHSRRYMVYDLATFDETLADYFLGVLRMPGAKNWFWEGRGMAVAAMPKEELAQVTTETLLLWGENDSLFPPANAQAALPVMPNAKLQTFSKCGHLPYLDKPRELVEALFEFFHKWSSGGNS